MRQGFSLVELSIVLVILGLLVGGVLTGQSLIRAAELRSVSTEFSKYQAAVNTFRDKYFQLPGDMNNATSFWGEAHATPATCKTTQGTGTQTCNGDGNGRISTNATNYANTAYEMYRFWQHLANAGLIEGNYTGVVGAGHATDHLIGGVNAPRAKIDNASWSVFTEELGVNPDWFLKVGHIMGIGGDVTNNWNYRAIFTNEEAWNIDTKMDDGKPGMGKVFTYSNSFLNTCATSDTASVAEYQLTSTATGCALLFHQPF